MHELPFDSDRRRMTLVYDEARGEHAFTKGAPEVVVERAVADRALSTAALPGLRRASACSPSPTRVDDPGSLGRVGRARLALVGVIALHDPLRARPEPSPTRAARGSPSGCSPATILRPHRRSDARSGSPTRRSSPARRPRTKLALVEELQESGEIVAVTGDGVNDAPALRRADVGVAMGMSGTEAAREAAAIVLTDDDFATIVAAVGEGRRIGDNIRKFVAFLLSANFGEVLVFAVAIVAGSASRSRSSRCCS